VLRVHHRPPETLPSHQRDFPGRGKAPDILHLGDTRTLLLMVAGYLMAMLGGIVLLAALCGSSWQNVFRLQWKSV